MWNVMIRLSLVLIMVLLSSCAGFRSADDTVVKSRNDSRAYRYVVLPNQLKVLLISDPATKKAAAALDVSVGSRHDPKERAGLAHFLEHMLFLGTEKYPDANEYNTFLSAHGGSHNAYTALENTNYFFDIEKTQLEPMLDRFAQFFVAPLFTAEYVDREKHAVHSEYMARIRDDARRQYDVLRDVVNQQHPLSKFSVGSLDTLADREGKTIRDDLLAFYDQHYSANRMTLVVLGQESLDDLERMVVSRFDAVPNRQRELDRVDVPLLEAQQKGQLVELQSIQQARRLDFLWPIPDQREHYRSKVISSIAGVLGHEGEGSLLSWLKQQGLAERLSAGQAMSWQGGATLGVSIDLTERGAEQWQQVAEAVYQMLQRLREEGLPKRLFDEERLLSEQSFTFMEQAEPINYVSRLASNLQKYPAEDVIHGPYRQDVYAPELLQAILSQLTPHEAIMALITPELTSETRSRYYSTPYRVSSLPFELRQQWATVSTHPAIRLPAPNPFVAEDVSVVANTAQAAIPQLKVQQAGLEVWHRQSAEFPLPKGDLLLSLFNSSVDDSPRHLVLSRLLGAVINDQLAEFTYPAYLAGLSYSVAIVDQGVNIAVSGYNDKQAVLLERILAAYTQPHFNTARFGLLKDDLKQALSNADKQSPYQLVLRQLPKLLTQRGWAEAEMLAEIDSIQLEDVQQHHQRLMQSAYVRLMLNGNYAEEQLTHFVSEIQNTIVAKTAVGQPPKQAVIQLEAQPKRYRVPSAYEDASIALYVQADTADRVRRAAMGLSMQVVKTDFFAQLRTDQQLGYIVSAMPYPQYDVAGAVFLVQSPVANALQLDQAIDRFLAQWKAKPREVLQAQFEQHRQALIALLEEKPKNLSEQSQLFWSDLNQGYVGFNSRQLLVDALQSLSFDQWLAYFHQDVLNNTRRLAVYVAGKDQTAQPQGVETAVSAQRALPAWYFP